MRAGSSLVTRFVVLAALTGGGLACFRWPPVACADGQPARLEVPALFNFAKFQQLFAKHYHSHLEAVTRRVYFLANAFNVYASGIAYKFRQQGHYLAVNEVSDLSPRERAKMRNKALSGALKDEPDSEAQVGPEPGPEPDPERVAEELEQEIGQVLSEPTLSGALEGKRRRKRDVAPASAEVLALGPRALSIDQLIKSDEPQGPAHRTKDVERWPKSNNPNYDALALEPQTMGLKSQQQEVSVWKLPKSSAAASPFADPFSTVARWLGLAKQQTARRRSANKPVEMFLDLRDSGCFFPPRNQRQCGSCYAFASISMMEFLYCNQTGKLVAFSEQYMVDCGKEHVKDMFGCDGAAGWAEPDFIHNFGLELAAHYPYVAREGHCPYDGDTDLKRTGFIRVELDSMTRVPISRWEDRLKYGPLAVSIATPKDFDFYGGGVFSGKECRQPDHAMVVVGHGREDGQEFWLIRNSHGSRWGDRGHFKLAKDAPKRCVELQEGFAYGSRNAQSYVEPRKNDLNRNHVLQQKYGAATLFRLFQS